MHCALAREAASRLPGREAMKVASSLLAEKRGSQQFAAADILNARRQPLVGGVPSVQTQLEVVVGERFRALPIKRAERDRLQGFAHKRALERQLLLRRQLAKDTIALLRYRTWNLLR